MSKDNSPPGFKSAYEKAKRIANDVQKATRLVNAAREKANLSTSRIWRMKADLENLFRMVSAWAKGDYRKIPTRTIIYAISGIVYFLNPFDIIHDYIPGVGYLDDAAILAFVLNAIQEDIKEFLIWEKHS